MRKPDVCICDKKKTTNKQRRWSVVAQYSASSFQIRNFKPLAIFCDCKARYVLDLVGNLKDLFCRDGANLSRVNDRRSAFSLTQSTSLWEYYDNMLMQYTAIFHANMSVQYTAIFHGCKNVVVFFLLFSVEKMWYFFLFLLKT